MPGNVTLQLTIALESCHQPSHLSWLSSMMLPIKPLQRSLIGPRKLSCSPVNLLLRSTSWVARDSGGNKFQLAQAVTRPIRSLKSQFEVRAQSKALAAVTKLAPLLHQLCRY